jgi:hypothetical protein
MKGLPMRRALTTGVVRRANICGSACHATSMKNPAHRRRSGASYFAQSLDGHGRTLSKQYAKANRARLNGDKRFIKMAPQSAFARAALPKS